MVFRDGKISLADLANYFKLENREVVLAGRNDSEEGTWSALLAPSLNYKPSVGNYGHIGTAQLSRLHLYVEQSKDSGIIVARLGYRPVEFRFTRSEKREFLL
jgi:hypothetical protein